VYQAIAYVMRQQGFKAGGVDLGLQVCDHSIARTGLFDETKCAANARTFGRDPRVIGVIGPLNSPCAFASLPETNRAGLAVLSPLASAPGLTRGARELYPTGRRHFARVFPPDDRQAEAMAELARRLGARRVAVLHDGDPSYGKLMATAFARRARELGLETSPGRWQPQARSQTRLAREVAEQRPDAVFLGGLLDTGGAAVLRALRARFGENTPLLAPDGFTPTPLLVRQAGRAAARGTYVSVNSLTAESLPPAGRRLVRAFSATLPGVEIEPSAVYAAAATQVMLDAIAAGGGTRDNVRRVMLSHSFDTVLGRTSFDATGNPRRAAVTILRIAPGRDTRMRIFEDAVIDRVLAP
jgi:branched-chain amino acid transport system substrate-binding protein